MKGQAVAACIQEQCQALLVPPLDSAGPHPPVLSPAAHLSTIPRVGLGLVLGTGLCRGDAAALGPCVSVLRLR